MLKNYLKIVLRNIGKQKSYAFINLAGLATGMACCMLILIYVYDELSYDKYHKKADRIFRITQKFDNPNGYHPHFARCVIPWLTTLPDKLPGMDELTRIQRVPQVVQYENRKFREQNFFVVDDNLLKVFSYPLVKGDKSTVLSEPGSAVISKAMADKYFGDTDPIGKTIMTLHRFAEADDKKDYKITGVMKNIPRNSHFSADFFVNAGVPKKADGWFYTYTLFTAGKDPGEYKDQIQELIRKNMGEGYASVLTLPFQKLTDIHLYSNINRELEPNSDIKFVYIFTISAFLILFIACINFMNLSTARSSNRAREIGIRKVLGSSRRQLIRYFLGESIVFCAGALLIAYLVVISALPAFNSLTGKLIAIQLLAKPVFILGFPLAAVIAGLLAGIYPAAFLSSFKPAVVLKGSKSVSSGKVDFRKILVSFQFAISIILIICTSVIYSQLEYITSKRLVTGKEQIITIRNIPDPVKKRYKVFKNTLLGNSEIINVSAAMEEPTKEILDAGQFRAQGIQQDPDNRKFITPLPVDESFIDFFELELLAGSTFPVRAESDTSTRYILNETAVNFIGWSSPEEAIGKQFVWRELAAGNVVGVVKDFNFSTVRKKIKPVVFFERSQWLFCILVKARTENIKGALAVMQHSWDKMFPQYPFEYDFLDDLYGKLYSAEERQGQVLGLFSILTIIVACLGLFGLASYTAEQRTKEIGIRKILGATLPDITILLSSGFLKLVLISNFFAWPVAYYAMNRWLEGFAYRTGINLNLFCLTGAAAILIALATVTYQGIKAGAANPVDALKYE